MPRYPTVEKSKKCKTYTQFPTYINVDKNETRSDSSMKYYFSPPTFNVEVTWAMNYTNLLPVKIQSFDAQSDVNKHNF
jgi:hypothetical protein